MEEQEVPSAEVSDIISTVQFSRNCWIIPQSGEKQGHQEDVVYVNETRVVNGEPVQIQTLYTKGNQKIGYVDSTTGEIIFDPDYVKNLKDVLGEVDFEKLELDNIKMEDILENNEFIEITLDKEIEGLTQEEKELILTQHGSKEIRDNLKSLKEEKEKGSDQEDPEQNKEIIAIELGIDPEHITDMEWVKDRTACEVLLMGQNIGYPLKIGLDDGQTKYAKKNPEGKYEDLGIQPEIVQGQETNYINENGQIERATVLARISNKGDTTKSIAIINTREGPKTVVERTAPGEDGKMASVSREMVTSGNEKSHMSGNIESMMDAMDDYDVRKMNEDVAEINSTTYTATMNELEEVPEENKKGNVTEKELEASERGEKEKEDEEGEKAPWDSASDRTNRSMY